MQTRWLGNAPSVANVWNASNTASAIFPGAQLCSSFGFILPNLKIALLFREIGSKGHKLGVKQYVSAGLRRHTRQTR